MSKQNNKGLRDPVWQFIWGAVSAVLAIIAIIVGILALPQAAPARSIISHAFAQATPTAVIPTAPTATPIPTPTPITITKKLDIPCTGCTYKIDVKLTTIVIDTTNQKSTWNFTLTNNDASLSSWFTILELEDNTGQKHQGGGPASTDRWNMSSGQSIQTYATFDIVHGTNYFLNISLQNGANVYQTETITF